MVLWNSVDAEAATSGKNTHDWEASGVSIDSRKVVEGDLFVAIIGENQDGHKYLAQAFANGAAAAMVNYIPEGFDDNKPLLVVEDTTEALRDMAVFRRNEFGGKLALITGSVGKTSVKEMLAHCLEHQGKVHYTIGNLNNHYGLPLTMARMPKDTDYAVIEVGMNHAGEISPLSVIAKPHVALITTVAAVHIEFFDSVEAIADAKSEVFDGLLDDGVAILNRDNEYYTRQKSNAQAKGVKNIVTFGQLSGADYNLVDYHANKIKATLDGREVNYELNIAGKHQALNSLAVLAVIDKLGADAIKAASSLKDFASEAGRGKLIEKGGISIIDDTYNASPVSVAAAIDVLAGYKPKRTLAVLGDMFELGEQSEELHLGLLEKLLENKIDLVFTAGSQMTKLFDKLPDSMQGGCEDNSELLCEKVSEQLQEGDVVLVKGSRGMKMEKVVNHILKEGIR